MPLELNFTIEGDKQLSRRLLILSDKVRDWTPAFQETALTLKNIFSNQVFETEGQIIEERWAPLSKAYALRKAKKYPGKGILEATGTMRNSFMVLWRSDMAQIWNTANYFKYHQSNQPRTKLPRRAMMKLAEAQRQEVVRIFNIYFQKLNV